MASKNYIIRDLDDGKILYHINRKIANKLALDEIIWYCDDDIPAQSSYYVEEHSFLFLDCEETEEKVRRIVSIHIMLYFIGIDNII